MAVGKWEDWFEKAVAERDKKVYVDNFGETPSQIYPLPDDAFDDENFEHSEDPSLLLNFVVEYAPNANRKSWLYVSSGLSNPIVDTDNKSSSEFSGLGFELIIETPEKANWPVQVLHEIMVSQILVSFGVGESELLDFHMIFPGIQEVLGKSKICSLVIVEPETSFSYAKGFELSSGVVDFFVLFGITKEEEDLLCNNDVIDIIDAFLEQTSFPVIDAKRESIKFGGQKPKVKLNKKK